MEEYQKKFFEDSRKNFLDEPQKELRKTSQRELSRGIDGRDQKESQKELEIITEGSRKGIP